MTLQAWRGSPDDPWSVRDSATKEILETGFASPEEALAWQPAAQVFEMPVAETAAPTAAPVAVKELTERQREVRAVAAASRSSRTLKLYKDAWSAFVAWCATQGGASPYGGAELVCEYLQDLTHGRVEGQRAASVLTVGVILAAISAAYQDKGLPSPAQSPGTRLYIRGLRRELGVAPRQVRAITEVELRAMLDTLPDSLVGKRDRALLLLGWAGCMRRSELVGLEVDDLREDCNGLLVRVRRSKTDQEGAGMVKAIPRAAESSLCPVQATKDWLTAAGLRSGKLFRGIDIRGTRVLEGKMDGGSVARVVKRALTAAGLDPDEFSAHSLRAGFLTAAALAGLDERSMANQSGHKSVAVLRSYVRRSDPWADNAATALVGGLGKGKRR